MFHLFEDKVVNSSFRGDGERCTFTFNTGPEQLSWIDSWIKNNMVNKAVSEVSKEGGVVTRVTVYHDISPTWTTKWKVVITAGYGSGMSAAQANMRLGFLWTLIIVAIIAYLVVRPIIQSIEHILVGTGGNGGGAGLFDFLRSTAGLVVVGLVVYLVVSNLRSRPKASKKEEG